MEILLATRNRNKLREFRDCFGRDFKVSDLSAFPAVALPEETGHTFAENAALKAVGVSQHRQLQDQHLLVLADDSGLEVDALGGAPGVFSARYAGENATDRDNVDKLLSELSQTRNRAARFRCALALARNSELLKTVEGTVDGMIVDVPRGSCGFGYDPVFVPAGFDQTFAELSSEVKNQISHRADAARQLRRTLQAALDQGFGGCGGGGGGGPGCPPPGPAAVRI
ncbi:MAG TPA: RdgB/HAM1 family non-canonical purine NTP pyrophosphatase [Chthoniobacterales bacterium]|nr:RdgB/HAM1 family non-canonical purine NTP pyrophosphatase [Chthoniobacterales bacterium]